VIPNLQEFVEEYMSDDAIGADGYLSERGLVVQADDVLVTTQDNVIDAVNMAAPQ
jgi:phosphate transport system substrate-binding protein